MYAWSLGGSAKGLWDCGKEERQFIFLEERKVALCERAIEFKQMAGFTNRMTHYLLIVHTCMSEVLLDGGFQSTDCWLRLSMAHAKQPVLGLNFEACSSSSGLQLLVLNVKSFLAGQEKLLLLQLHARADSSRIRKEAGVGGLPWLVSRYDVCHRYSKLKQPGP